MGKIKAGDLRQRVTLIRPDTTVGEHKRRETTWTEVATVPAAKSDVSGREFFAAHAVNAEDIVKHGEITYGVLEVNHLGYMRDYLRLKCRSVTGGGV